MKIRCHAAVGLIAALCLMLAFANAEASRYARSAPDALTPEQEHPLLVRVTLDFPPAYISTVGDAVRFALARSGYTVAGDATLPDQATLFALPLPEVHRHFVDTQLQTVLQALGRPGYRLSVDDLHRIVGYRVVNSYRNYSPQDDARDAGTGDRK